MRADAKGWRSARMQAALRFPIVSGGGLAAFQKSSLPQRQHIKNLLFTIC